MGCQSLRGGLTSAPRPRSAFGRALARPSRPVSGWGQGRQPPEAVAPSASLEASRSQVYFKIQLLPGDRACLPPSLLRSLLPRSLMPASGHQDHTTSPSASTRARQSRGSRPPHPAPTFVTMANAPLRDRTGQVLKVIWVTREGKYFCKRDWTRDQPTTVICPSGKSTGRRSTLPNYGDLARSPISMKYSREYARFCSRIMWAASRGKHKEPRSCRPVR
jgi:hypothetical protein